MAEYTKESGHWYEPDGKPAYTIIGKNGSERNTTLRDAKKLGLLPSVTQIIRCAASPGLQQWKDQQLLMSALTITRNESEPEKDYIDRIIKDSQEQSLKARERGTHIHAIVQSGFEGKLDTISSDNEYYYSALEEIQTVCGNIEWQCEKSFATDRYGGKIDLQGGTYLIDIKTTEKDLLDIKTWPDHHMQLAAYDYDKLYKCGILYINIKTTNSKLVFVTDEELKKGWDMFSALLDFYYAKTGLGE